jgi:hypothetical protein
MSDTEDKVVLSPGFPIDPDCIPVRSIEVVTFLNPDGKEEIGVRWQGSNNLVAELGMLEYAKLIITDERLD